MLKALRCALIAACVSFAASAQEPLPIGQVAAVKSAQVARDGGAPRPLSEGDFLFEGDRVLSAAPDAGLHMVFADRSSVTLGADSEAVIARYRAGAGGRRLVARFELRAGILRATLDESGGPAPFEVRSAEALAKARATDWVVEAGAGRSTVYVIGGRVLVSASQGGSIVLTPGFGSEVPAGLPPARAARWDEARVRALLARCRVPSDLEGSHQVIQ